MYLIPVVVSLGVLLVFGQASPPPANDSCQAKMTVFPLEAGSMCCTHAADRKLISGNRTEIDQDPWVALIDYDIKKVSGKRLCSGTLISGKYVLTAAHCVLGPVQNIATPTKVRLGEYNLNNEGPDCVTVELGSMDCTDGAVIIDIETIIPHPKYNPKSTSKANDIALIRLKKAAPYTDFIRPICLPTTNPETNPPDYSMHAISWNKDNEKIIYTIPFVNQEKCQLIYTKPRFNVDLGQGQLCAGGLEGQDPCRGDGGGPLVYDTKEGRAELVGIVSFGPVPCGQKDIPSIYTNIYEYLDWIKSVIVE